LKKAAIFDLSYSTLKDRIIKIAIADDHNLFRVGMSTLLSDTGKVQVIGEAVHGAELLEMLSEKDPAALPDVILMDLQMPVMDGFTATRRVSEKYPDIKILALSMHSSDHVISHAMDCGASGYLSKDSDLEVVLQAINRVMSHGIYLCEKTTAIMSKRLISGKPMAGSSEPLTDRETDIVRLICEQKSAREIGEELSLSPRTVETHKARILKKTGARNTAGLVMYAMTNNITSHYLFLEGSKI
jgi:DNA-binding NarL/FixJ family response regulator